MIYSKYAIDYSKGVTLESDGTIKGKKIGCFVLTTLEADFLLICRKLRGEELSTNYYILGIKDRLENRKE